MIPAPSFLMFAGGQKRQRDWRTCMTNRTNRSGVLGIGIRNGTEGESHLADE